MILHNQSLDMYQKMMIHIYVYFSNGSYHTHVLEENEFVVDSIKNAYLQKTQFNKDNLIYDFGCPNIIGIRTYTVINAKL